MKEKRRRVPRQNPGWLGKCAFEGDPGSSWYECQVLDVSILGSGLEVSDLGQSLLGAGLEIFSPVPQDLVGNKITVDAHTPERESVSFRFTGLIRHVRSELPGSIRAGIEFLGLSPTERTMLDALERMRVVW